MAAAIDDRLAELRLGKVEVNFKAIGGAPVLKNQRFTIDGAKTFGELITFLKGSLKMETLHVYCCDAFEPMQDEYIADLKRCFGTGNKLNLSYSSAAAFS